MVENIYVVILPVAPGASVLIRTYIKIVDTKNKS